MHKMHAGPVATGGLIHLNLTTAFKYEYDSHFTDEEVDVWKAEPCIKAACQSGRNWGSNPP